MSILRPSEKEVLWTMDGPWLFLHTVIIPSKCPCSTFTPKYWLLYWGYMKMSHIEWQWHLRLPTILHPSSPLWSMSTSPQFILPVAWLSLPQHSHEYNSSMTTEKYREKYHEEKVISWRICGSRWFTALPSLVWDNADCPISMNILVNRNAKLM